MTKQTKLPTGQSIKWDEKNAIVLYSNIMALGMTPFDISVTFGQIGFATPTEVEANALAKVVLSPEQAVNLMRLLTVATQKYVIGNGALRTAGAVDMESLSKEMDNNAVMPATGADEG